MSLKEILHRGAKRPISTLGPRSGNIAITTFEPKKNAQFFFAADAAIDVPDFKKIPVMEFV